MPFLAGTRDKGAEEMFLMVTWSCGDWGEEWWALIATDIPLHVTSDMGLLWGEPVPGITKEGGLGLGWELGQVSAGDLVTLCGSILPDSLPPEGAQIS